MEVIKTKDYGKFTFADENRSIDKGHLIKLKESMKNNGYWPNCPIEIDQNYCILDGQHRYYAAKELGIELYFCFISNNNNYILLKNNTQREWKYLDYLNYFIKKENVNYIRFKDFINEFDLAVSMGRKVFGITGKVFKSGLMDLDNTKIEKGKRIAAKAKEVIDIINISDTHLFAALVNMASVQKYDHSRMIKNINKRAGKVKPDTSAPRYIQQLEDIYNSGVPYGKRVNFRMSLGN